MLDTGDPECRYDRRALFPGGSCYPLSRDRGRDRSGKEKKDQLAVIFEVLGTPTPEEVDRVRTEGAREYLRSVKPRPPEDLNRRFPTAGTEATDLLRWMLRFHPEDRIGIDVSGGGRGGGSGGAERNGRGCAGSTGTVLTIDRLLTASLHRTVLSAQEALAHPFLAPVRRPHDEAGRPDGRIKFRKVTSDNIRDLMVEEIRAYKCVGAGAAWRGATTENGQRPAVATAASHFPRAACFAIHLLSVLQPCHPGQL